MGHKLGRDGKVILGGAGSCPTGPPFRTREPWNGGTVAWVGTPRREHSYRIEIWLLRLRLKVSSHRRFRRDLTAGYLQRADLRIGQTAATGAQRPRSGAKIPKSGGRPNGSPRRYADRTTCRLGCRCHSGTDNERCRGRNGHFSPRLADATPAVEVPGSRAVE